MLFSVYVDAVTVVLYNTMIALSEMDEIPASQVVQFYIVCSLPSMLCMFTVIVSLLHLFLTYTGFPLSIG